MTVIRLETLVAAPPERCFDLSLSVDVHLLSAAATDERVVSGPPTGVLRPGDSVTWEARHFGRRWRLRVMITAHDRPRTFRDEMVEGPFRRMRHDHLFEPTTNGTQMRDEFDFASPVPLLDAAILGRYVRRFLERRNDTIRRLAEGDEWRRYLGAGEDVPDV